MFWVFGERAARRSALTNLLAPSESGGYRTLIDEATKKLYGRPVAALARELDE